MVLLNNGVANLVAGYDRIREADLRLPGEWRHRLLVAYARRREAYDLARGQHRQQIADLNRKAMIGLAVAAVLLLGGLFLSETSDCLGPLLLLTGVMVGGPLAIIWLWKVVISSPKPPRHPLRGSLRAMLFPPLLSLWYERLGGRLPANKPYEGATGEYAFIRRLARLGAGSSYILYRLQQRYGDDVDVTVIGPKGVWVFEVKYWSGTITWRNGEWFRAKSYYKPGGIPVTEPGEVGQPPDQQWQRMTDDVAETLRRRAPRLLARLPVLTQVKGGLVFTHPEASYDIGPGCPCARGDIADWTRQLAKAPVVPGLSERIVLHILDALLVRHRQVSETRATHSMDAYAAQLVQNVESRLVKWTRDER